MRDTMRTEAPPGARFESPLQLWIAIWQRQLVVLHGQPTTEAALHHLPEPRIKRLELGERLIEG